MDKKTFKKEERLCSKKVIEQMFAIGQSTLSFPIKAVYLNNSSHHEKIPLQAAFTVPKRLFKRAPKRNLLKRRMRESYRLNKEQLLGITDQLSVMFIYISKDELPYDKIDAAMKKAMIKIRKSLVNE